MKQKKAATIFTAIIFIIAIVFLRMHFSKPTESDTLVKQSYQIADLQTPYTPVKQDKYTMTVVATQGPELYVQITNETSKEITLDDKVRIYNVTVDGTRIKINDQNYVRVEIGRGTGRAEIVKKIPAGATREAVFDCSNLGKFTPGCYVLMCNNRFIFFELQENPAAA